MKHLDQRIYAGTALVAAIAATAVLYVTQPVDLAVIGTADAAERTPLSTWKGVRNVIMHEGAGRASRATPR
jgi:hypothetical protein